MTLKEEIIPYLDKWGYVQPDTTGRSCANNRFTAEWYLTIHRLDIIDSYDKAKFIRLFELCEVIPGVLARHPYEWLQDYEAPDDYIAMTHAASFIAPEKAIQVYKYGVTEGWNYNNLRPSHWTPRSWFGRRSEIIAHFFFCAGLHPPFLLKLYWCLCVFLAAYRKKSDQDGWVLSWHLVNAARGKSKLCDLFGKFLYWKLRRSKPDNIGEILADYFQDRNHPIAKYFVT